jgi:uncharacterized protein (TIGR03435 family)
MTSLDSQLPSWAKTDRFDIEARAPGNPTKDEMRLMMRAVLADRFQLKIHTESQEASVLALQLVKPGLTGPQLQPHPENSKCSNKAEEDTTTSSDFEGKHIGVGNFPSGLACGGVLGFPPSEPNLLHLGARNVTVGLIAAGMTSWGNLGKAVVDKTGLSGMYDFSLEWLPDRLGSDSAAQVENAGPGFLQAVKEQLGLKLTTQKGSIQVIVLDHLEHPSAN